MANELHPSRQTLDYAQLLSESFHLEENPTNLMKIPSSDHDANESTPLERSPNSISSISRSNLGRFVSEEDQLKKAEGPVGAHESPKDVRKSATSRKSCPALMIRLGWWGEIGSILFSIICTVLIFVILVTMDGKPMSKWHLPIQPNSLIAVFSALARSSLLYPIAECIGQLKWTYFERPRSLDRMEIFDGATRGPWGSITFLWKTKATMLLASLGALITVILLAFEPFAQQAIGFSTRLAPLNNITGSVTKTNAWSDVFFTDNESPLTSYVLAQLHLSSAFLQALADQPMNGFSNAYCPTKKCTFPDYISLAVCATCIDESISEGYFDTCNYSVKYGEYDSNNFINFNNAQDMREYLHENPDYSEMNANCTKDFSEFPEFTVALNVRDGASTLRHTESWKPEINEQKSTSNGKNSAMDYTDRYLQSCNGRRHDEDSQLTKIVGQTCFNSTTNLVLYNNTDHIGQINGTVSKCRLDFCVKKYEHVVIDRDEMTSQITSYTQLEGQNGNAPGTDAVWHSKQTQDFGLIDFRVGETHRRLLTGMIEDMFDDWMIRRAMYYPKIPRTTSLGNWTSRFHHLADIMSLIIQAPPNPNATNMTGQVYEDVIFIHVHWGWIIMPISIVILSTIFLVLTIVESRKKPYLFKTSILATIFHGLEERSVSDVSALTETNRVVSKDLVRESETIVVKLKRNNEDMLKLLGD